MPNCGAATWSKPIRQAVASGKPFLGHLPGPATAVRCRVTKDGQHEGLGILPGDVVRFEVPHEYKVPHMGWNQLPIRRRPPLLTGLPNGRIVYFVHSYYVVPRDRR